jgi:hypothetical protein
VTLVDWSPRDPVDAEVALVTGALYPHVTCRSSSSTRGAFGWPAASAPRCCGLRRGAANRRHRPGRGFERVWYRFDVLGDYGGFRDLQRHRMLTIEWQDLTTRSTATRPRPSSRRPGSPTVGTRPSSDRQRCTSAAARRPSRPGPVRGVLRLPGALRHADERPRGDADARAALDAAGTPAVPADRPGDAPPDPRGGGHTRSPTRCATSTTASELERLEAERAAEARRAAPVREATHEPGCVPSLLGLVAGMVPLLLLDLARILHAHMRDGGATSLWWPIACYAAVGGLVAATVASGVRVIACWSRSIGRVLVLSCSADRADPVLPSGCRHCRWCRRR